MEDRKKLTIFPAQSSILDLQSSFFRPGEVAEWSKAAVSKTVIGIKLSIGGSNPPLSAGFVSALRSANQTLKILN